MNRTFKKIENNPVKQYEKHKAAIEKLLKEIESGLQVHDRGASISGGVHWGYVGDLASIEDTLKDLRDRLHGKGEYA